MSYTQNLAQSLKLRLLEDKNLLFLLGFILPWGSVFGNGTQLILCYLFLILLGIKSPPAWSAPFLLIVTAWCGARLGVDVGLWSLSAGSGPYEWTIVAEFYSWLRTAPGTSETIGVLFRTLLPFIAYASLRKFPDALPLLVKGAAFGVLVSVCALFAQLGGLNWFSNQTSFWSSQNRYASSFTDPNAAGVFLGLFLPVLLRIQNIPRTLVIFSAASVLTVGLMSGSRTFILAVLLLVFFRLPTKKAKLLGVSGLFFLWLSLNAAQNFAPDDFNQILERAPSGVSRTIKTIGSQSSEESLFSRKAFSIVGVEAWLENPIVGVGPGQFFLRVTEFAAGSGVPLGLWRDNPNNYYLGILAEFGIIGGLLFLLMILSIKFNERCSLSRESIIILGFLLFLGPHLSFDEVSIFAGFLFADGIKEKESHLAVGLGLKICALIASIAVITKALFGASGLYEWERDDGGYYRWTGPAARLSIPCSLEKGVGELILRNALPGGTAEVMLYSPLSKPVSLSVAGLEAATLHCKIGDIPLMRVPVTLIVKNPWVPKNHGLGNDERWLGVQVRMDPLKRYD